MIVYFLEVIKLALLLQEIKGSGFGGFEFQGSVHALVLAILLRVSGFDAFDKGASVRPFQAGTFAVLASSAIGCLTLRLPMNPALPMHSATLQKVALWIAAELKAADKRVAISLPATDNINAKILLVGFQKQSSNAVPRGENAGAQLAHRNSVTTIIPLGDWHGAALNISKQLPAGDGVAVLIQSFATGEIIGAAWL